MGCAEAVGLAALKRSAEMASVGNVNRTGCSIIENITGTVRCVEEGNGNGIIGSCGVLTVRGIEALFCWRLGIFL